MEITKEGNRKSKLSRYRLSGVGPCNQPTVTICTNFPSFSRNGLPTSKLLCYWACIGAIYWIHYCIPS